MKPTVIGKIQGLAPRFDPNLYAGYARIAENIDLSSEKIAPLAGPALITADTTGANTLFYHAGTWYTGNDKDYLSWSIGDLDLLIYLTDGVPYKTVSGVSAPLGQTRRAAPTVAENGAGDLDDTYYYFITTTRSVGGHTDESGPSAVSAEITVASKIIRVTAPAITDDNVTHWNIYRVSNSSGDYQFVAQVAAATTTYDDNTIDADLDTAPTTWYTSDQGNQILFDAPQVTFDGMMTEPHGGMLFAWKGNTLYWTEPGYPDAWVGFYNMNFPSDIQACFPFAGALAVITARAPHRVDGTHPELLQPSKTLGNEPCLSTGACLTSLGVVYYSDSGPVLFNLIQTTVLSDERFTEAWFNAHVEAATVFFAVCDNVLYLFHSTGILVLDKSSGKPVWTTRTAVATAAHMRPDTGDLYYLDAVGVQQMGAGAEVLTWTWRSGDITRKTPADKLFFRVRMTGSGAVTGTVYVDDVQVAEKALSFTGLDRDQTIPLPTETKGRALQISLTGTGSVNEIIIEADTI